MSEIDLPKISIITVCYNAAECIEKTIQSVVEQTYKNIQYIIIDGKSKDNTLEIVSKYKDKIEIIISEPDKGLYDAMNKSFQYATGNYVWFMNAGDIIPHADTLEKVMQYHKDEDFVYGTVEKIDEQGNRKAWHKPHPKAEGFSWRSLQNGMLICHQSMLMKRSITEEYRLEYRIVGDLDWTIRCLKKAKTVRDSGVLMCRFLDGGLSSKRRRASWIERFKILREHFGFFPTFIEHIRIIFQAVGGRKN